MLGHVPRLESLQSQGVTQKPFDGSWGPQPLKAEVPQLPENAVLRFGEPLQLLCRLSVRLRFGQLGVAGVEARGRALSLAVVVKTNGIPFWGR